MKLETDLIGIKYDVLLKCYYAIKQSEEALIEKSFVNPDYESTCEGYGKIETIGISCCSISNDLTINGKLCTDYDNL